MGISQADLIAVCKEAYRKAGFILKEEKSDVWPEGRLGKTRGVKHINLTFEFSTKKEGVVGEARLHISMPTTSPSSRVPTEIRDKYFTEMPNQTRNPAATHSLPVCRLSCAQISR
jgi:hypothetical protein